MKSDGIQSHALRFHNLESVTPIVNMLPFTGYPANGNFAALYKVLLRKRGLLTPASRSYAPEQHGVQVLSEQ